MPPTFFTRPPGRTAYRAAKLTALGLVAVIVILSVVPGADRPHTGASGQFEHFMAYSGATFLIGIAAARPPTLALPLAFATLAALLEWVQQFIPGRTSQLIDWVASSFGGAIGAFLAAAALWAIRSAWRARASQSAAD
ncbi:hypothetical protein GCM10007036_15900 [Alsobacter metallidurans]|uniref:VanZ-like domain-containing protein n=1 Tax=Alsobacter metallidurans TaxID=340221 RepID=A0A917I696_9HYPH|nr:VanZ family protein [Alsobacter metallidurans]GGH15726.1 hypothetical protein GCM10007036_15900 [Alsobacter metallidurans]